MITTEEAITIHQATATDAAVLAELGRRTTRQTYSAIFAIEEIDRVAEQRFNLNCTWIHSGLAEVLEQSSCRRH